MASRDCLMNQRGNPVPASLHAERKIVFSRIWCQVDTRAGRRGGWDDFEAFAMPLGQPHEDTSELTRQHFNEHWWVRSRHLKAPCLGCIIDLNRHEFLAICSLFPFLNLVGVTSLSYIKIYQQKQTLKVDPLDRMA
jgi:hypothetical protein